MTQKPKHLDAKTFDNLATGWKHVSVITHQDQTNIPVPGRFGQNIGHNIGRCLGSGWFQSQSSAFVLCSLREITQKLRQLKMLL